MTDYTTPVRIRMDRLVDELQDAGYTETAAVAATSFAYTLYASEGLNFDLIMGILEAAIVEEARAHQEGQR